MISPNQSLLFCLFDPYRSHPSSSRVLFSLSHQRRQRRRPSYRGCKCQSTFSRSQRYIRKRGLNKFLPISLPPCPYHVIVHVHVHACTDSANRWLQLLCSHQCIQNVFILYNCIYCYNHFRHNVNRQLSVVATQSGYKSMLLMKFCVIGSMLSKEQCEGIILSQRNKIMLFSQYRYSCSSAECGSTGTQHSYIHAYVST